VLFILKFLRNKQKKHEIYPYCLLPVFCTVLVIGLSLGH